MEIMDIENTTALVIEKDGRFLLIKRLKEPRKGYWGVPGGHVEKNETIKECAIREAEEEVGSAEVDDKPFFIFTHYKDQGHGHKCHTFKARIRGNVKLNWESSDFEWFSPEEIKKKKITNYTRIIFNHMGLL